MIKHSFRQFLGTFLSVTAIVSATLLSPVSAEIKDACGTLTGDAKTACEAGYNGAICSSYGQNVADCNAGAAQAAKDKGTQNTNGTTGTTGGTTNNANKCGGTKTEIVSCDQPAGLGAIASLIKTAIMIVTLIIGIVAVGGITYAAILYASARDNQNQVSEAITVIRNVVIGLLLYGFTIAIVNWLIPGGVIG